MSSEVLIYPAARMYQYRSIALERIDFCEYHRRESVDALTSSLQANPPFRFSRRTSGPGGSQHMSAYPDDDTGFDPVQTIDGYAGYYGVPANFAQAVMQRESGGNHYDRNGQVVTSSRGYRGLMGMHPVTAAFLGLGFNADDPEENVHAGLKYLGQKLELCNHGQE